MLFMLYVNTIYVGPRLGPIIILVSILGSVLVPHERGQGACLCSSWDPQRRATARNWGEAGGFPQASSSPVDFAVLKGRRPT